MPLIGIRLDPELVAKIDEAAAIEGKSRSEVVRDILTERFTGKEIRTAPPGL
jgi:metal-responsive CopG/Arc/MetJ family transcriptional regulator